MFSQILFNNIYTLQSLNLKKLNCKTLNINYRYLAEWKWNRYRVERRTVHCETRTSCKTVCLSQMQNAPQFKLHCVWKKIKPRLRSARNSAPTAAPYGPSNREEGTYCSLLKTLKPLSIFFRINLKACFQLKKRCVDRSLHEPLPRIIFKNHALSPLK